MRAAALALAFILPACAARIDSPRTALDVLAGTGFAELKGKRVGVITNPTGVDRRLADLPRLLVASGVQLVAVFGPEHGVAGAAGAGERVGDTARNGVPVYSLYGERRRPTREMLAGIDVLVFDIQDIGVRCYTYLSTLAECLGAAGELGVELWVLDRPVPIGAVAVEGPVLEPGQESFVGAHTVPLRHGLTAGEFARMVNAERGLKARLRVVAMDGYRRGLPYEAFAIPWVPPSPAIPTVDTALAYAGTVLIEGTNLSEGRGTALPFQLIGAPWVNGEALAEALNTGELPGCIFRAAVFVPSASKHAGERCSGIQIHITDRRAYPAVTVAVALLLEVRRLHPGRLEVRPDTFDRLAGTPQLRQAIERGASLEEITGAWQAALESYRERRRQFLLYPE